MSLIAIFRSNFALLRTLNCEFLQEGKFRWRVYGGKRTTVVEEPLVIRTGWDSNPRYPCGYTGFRDRRLQPLGHLSWLGRKIKVKRVNGKR